MEIKDREAEINFAFEQAEKALHSTETLAIAADQRAATSAGIMLAAAFVVGFESDGSIPGVAAALLLGVSALLLLASARAVSWQTVGQAGENFLDAAWEKSSFGKDHQNLTEIKYNQIEHIDEAADLNRQTMRRNGRLFNYGLFLAALSPITALILSLC